MAVLHVFEPPDGGVPQHVAALAAGLRARGHPVEVAGPAASAVFADLESRGIPTWRIEGFRREWTRPHDDARALRALIRLIRERDVSVLHCHSSKAGLLGRLAGRITRIPVLYTPHCFGFIGEVSRMRKTTVRVAERALAPLTKRIICVSEWERRVAREAGFADRRLTVIRNGADPVPESLAPPAHDLVAFRGEGLLVAAVAALRRQKRLDVLIDAAPSVLERVPSARIAVVGEGPEGDALQERAERLGLPETGRFAFFPFTPPGERYLRALDVFVLSSSWESLPISLIEALACGTPQVATEVGGSPEVVDSDTGRLVPPNDPRALADAVVNLLEEPQLRASLSRMSRERHEAAFAADRMVASMTRIYDEVMNGSSTLTN